MATTISRDACVVATEPLAEMLQGYVANWQRERPPTAGRFTDGATRTDVTPMGALEALADEIGRTPGARRVPLRTLENIKTGRWRSTELDVADAILTALGRPEAFHDGTLTIRARSKRSASRCASCGGSSAASIPLVDRGRQTLLGA